MSDGGMIFITSGVSAFTGQGFIDLRWGKEAAQLTPAECREHALALLEAAEAAESDAAVYAELKDHVGLPGEAAAGFLARLRERRADG